MPTQFGSGQETEAQLAGMAAGGRLTGRKNLKQTKPVFYTGSWRHRECGVITIEKAAARADGRAVNALCTVCKHNTTISIKKWRLKEVAEVIDLCDSD